MPGAAGGAWCSSARVVSAGRSRCRNHGPTGVSLRWLAGWRPMGWQRSTRFAVLSGSLIATEHKNDLAGLSRRQLLARRRVLAGRVGDVERVLAGSLTVQARRCGKAGCRCAGGELHGAYAYFSPRPHGTGRLRYVPAGLVETVRGYLRRGEQAGAALAEISAINAELLGPARAGVAGGRRGAGRPRPGRGSGGGGQHDVGSAGRLW
jgi:hypothetical protein